MTKIDDTQIQTTAVTAGSYGDGTHYTTFTVNAEGILTAAASVALPAGSGGTVTSVTAGTGLTGGTFTTSGTIALDLTRANTWTGLQTLNAGLTVGGAKATLAAATTSYPSLNVPSGTAPTTIASGDLWWDGTKLYFGTAAATKRALNPRLFIEVMLLVDQQTTTSSTHAVVDPSLIHFDPTQYDNITAVYFEALMKCTNAVTTQTTISAQCSLYNLTTAADVANSTLIASQPAASGYTGGTHLGRQRSADVSAQTGFSLTTAQDYQIKFWSNDNTNTASIAYAKLIIQIN